jgi:transcriptional regulator with XRE-family HTH domain
MEYTDHRRQLIALRKQMNLSQRKFALLFNLNRSTLAMFERGKRPLSQCPDIIRVVEMTLALQDADLLSDVEQQLTLQNKSDDVYLRYDVSRKRWLLKCLEEALEKMKRQHETAKNGLLFLTMDLVTFENYPEKIHHLSKMYKAAKKKFFATAKLQQQKLELKIVSVRAFVEKAMEMGLSNAPSAG